MRSGSSGATKAPGGRRGHGGSRRGALAGKPARPVSQIAPGRVPTSSQFALRHPERERQVAVLSSLLANVYLHYVRLSRFYSLLRAEPAQRFQLKRRTAKTKYKAKVRDLKHWFHLHLTTPLSEVWATLNAKFRGHYQYYGINDNWPWLMKFRGAAKRLAYRWLNRRSQSKSKNWKQFYAYLDRFPLAAARLTDLIALARSR